MVVCTVCMVRVQYRWGMGDGGCDAMLCDTIRYDVKQSKAKQSVDFPDKMLLSTRVQYGGTVRSNLTIQSLSSRTGVALLVDCSALQWTG